MRLIMDIIGPELSELYPLEFAKIAESVLCLHHSIYKCRPISTKRGHSIYDDEIDYGSDLSYIWSYMPLNKEKLFGFVYTLSI